MENLNNEWFTFQVILHRKEEGTDVYETHEFKDCTPEKCGQYRNEVWTKGIRVNQTPSSWEVLSPFMVKQVFIIKQDKKYNP